MKVAFSRRQGREVANNNSQPSRLIDADLALWDQRGSTDGVAPPLRELGLGDRAWPVARFTVECWLG